MQTTYPKRETRGLALAATFSLLLSSGLAQVATPNPSGNAKPDPAGEETIVLSPFVVDSSKDEGYRATSTLAGSRINTPLKDVAQSITVVTKEFLNDLAAVNVNDVLSYTAGTEGNHDFTTATVSLGRPTDGVASNANNTNRIRGLSAADYTRGYFYTIGTYNGFDSYNLDEVTINRGPNSILAGLGSPAGIINFSPQLAGLARNHNQVSLRFGSYGDFRATLNSNVVAKKDVLGFRVAAAHSDKGFKQKPAYNKDDRLYFTGTYQPWSKTTIRLGYETQKVKANNPNTITPEDGITQWIAAGKPIYDSAVGTVGTGLNQNFLNQPVIIYNASGANEGGYNASYNQPASRSYEFYQATKSGATAYRLNDNDYINLQTVNLNPSLDDHRNYNAFNFSVDQEILPHLNANLAYVKEKVDAKYLNLFRSGYSIYSVDVNAKLPNGAANTHVGETFMQFGSLDNLNTDDNSNEVWRGTVNYDLDLTKQNKWFGRYLLTAFTEKRKTETIHWQYNTKDAANPTVESFQYRYYLGGNAGNGYKAQTVPQNPIMVTGINNYLDYSNGAFSTRTFNSFYGLKSNAKSLRNLTTSAFVVQGYLWDDRIVPMFGVRRDKDETSTASAVNNTATPGVVSPAGAYGPVNNFTKITRTYGVVVHALKWLSVHYNHSENFIPNAGAVDMLLNPTPSPTGLTKEFGFSVNLLEDKLNAKLNWFELTAAGAGADNLTFPLGQWTVPYMELTFMPDLARQAGITYKPYIASGLVVGDPRLQNAYTSANVSKGIELELTYNVTKNWRIMGSISKQEAKQSDIAAPLTAFIENRLAYWKSIPALWTGPYVGQNVGWGVGRTGEQQWNNDNNSYYLLYKSVDGQPSPQLAKWRASGLTNYSFTEGPLKHFSIGGGVRFIEKSIIGNPRILNSSGTPIGLDLANPYYNAARLGMDVWAGYKMKVSHDKYDLSFQLNIRDLEQGGGFQPIAANPDGSHSTYRIVQPRSYYLTTTLDF